MTKTLKKLEIKGSFLNLIKNIYKKPTINILTIKAVKGKKQDTFHPPKIEIKARVSLPITPIQSHTGSLSEIKLENKIKHIQIEK